MVERDFDVIEFLADDSGTEKDLVEFEVVGGGVKFHIVMVQGEYRLGDDWDGLVDIINYKSWDNQYLILNSCSYKRIHPADIHTSSFLLLYRTASALNLALNVVNREDVQEGIKERLDADFLYYLQVCDTHHFLKLPLVNHPPKIHCRYLLYQRLYLLQKWKSLLVQCHQEAYPTILFQNALRKHKCLYVIRHQHEGKTKENSRELPRPYHLLDFVKVTIVDLHSWIPLENLLCFLCIIGVQINAYNFSVIGLELIDNFFERGASAAPNIKEVSLEHCHVFDHLDVGSDGKEGADKEVINEDREFFYKAEHGSCCYLLDIIQYCKRPRFVLYFSHKLHKHPNSKPYNHYNPFTHNQIFILSMPRDSKDIEKEIQQKIIQQQLQRSLELRRKIVNKQLDKLQNMPLSQLIQRERRPKPTAPTDHTKKYFEGELNKTLKESGFQSSLQNPGEKHAQIFKETEKRVREFRRDLKQNPVMAQVKRGKLGFDSVLIAFAILGFVMLPAYFGKKIMDSQRKIVQSRGVDPKIIENLDEDSPISLDSVSQQSIHYLNTDREEQVKKILQRHNKISQLKRELDL